MTEQRRYQIAFLSVSFVQGSVTAFFSVNAVYLRGLGLSLTSIGLLGTITLLPMLLRPLVGLVSDVLRERRGVGRRWLISLGVATQSLGFCSAAFTDPVVSYWTYVAGLLLVLGGMALYSACVNGFAIDAVEESQYGPVQGLITGARYSAVLVGPFFLALVASQYSWRMAFLSLAILSLAPIAWLVLLTEPRRQSYQPFAWRKPLSILRPPSIYACAIGFIAMLTTSGPEALWLSFLSGDLGISLRSVGIVGSVFGGGTVVGALIGGPLFQRLEWKRTNILAAVMVTVSLTTLSTITGPVGATLAGFCFGLAMGLVHVAVLGLGMKVATRGAEASSFGLYSTFMALGTTFAMYATGWLADVTGFRMSFAISGLVALMIIPVAGLFEQSASRESERQAMV